MNAQNMARGGVMLAAIASLLIAATPMLIRQVGPRRSLGIIDNRLAPCPTSPNCVSSYSSDQEHSMVPLPYRGNTAAAKSKLLQILAQYQRVTVVQDTPDYVHAIFQSRLFGFQDDVEFYFDEGAGMVHYRSASRIGFSDSGVNHARMTRIRSQLGAALQ
ncbi:MAG: DUF1499 domain-containing protein [Herpetosiphon sp.]